MDTNRIVLHPVDPQPRHLDRPALVARLCEGGLIEGPARHGRFLPGPRFMELMVFLGCSPYVKLRPDAAADAQHWDFSHVQIPTAVAVPRLLSGLNTRAPRCPRCRGEAPDWRLRLQPIVGSTPTPRWPCPACGSSTLYAELNWRHGACVTGFPLSIWQVHEGEAVPSDELLQLLEAGGDGPWDYCYLREPAQE